MGLLVANPKGKKTAEMSQSSSAKIERKVIEKNRRNNMKTLYSILNSLIPSGSAKTQEALPLPDQIDEAIGYIKSLEGKIKISKEKKERLTSMSKKRCYSCTNFAEHTTTLKAPKLEIRETGSALEIVLITGMENQFLFYDVLRILQEEGAEVASANYSGSRGSVTHVVHAQIREPSYGFGATKVTERLSRLIHASTSDILLEPELYWDFDNWEF